MKKIVVLVGLLAFSPLSIAVQTIKMQDVSQEDDRKALCPQIHEKFLSNGLRVIVVPFGTSDVVHVGILYHVGSVDDPESKIGLSHFVEHMMFDGTFRFTKEKVQQFYREKCLYSNASTGQDYTLYQSSCKKEFLRQVLDFESDRMQHLKILKEEFEREKKVILEEKKETFAFDLTRLDLLNARKREAYLYSPYAYPVIGYVHHIQNISLKAVKKHYRKFYIPNNATLVLVGNIQKGEAYKLAEKYFGTIPKGQEIEKKEILEPIDKGRFCRFDKTSSKIKTKTLSLFYAFEKKMIATFRKRMALSMGINILFGQMGLPKKMIYNKKILSGTETGLNCSNCNKAEAIVVMKLDFKAKKKHVLKMFFQLLEDKKKFLTEEALKKEKEDRLRSFKFLGDFSYDVFANTVSEITEFPVCELNNRIQIIKGITLDEIHSVLEEAFQKENLRQEIYVHPAKE